MTTTAQAPASALVGFREAKTKGLGNDLFILVGNPKTGKTSLAASFPDSYVLELEPKGGDRVPGRIHEIKDLAEFRKVMPQVLKEPSIKTVVIDTIDVLSDWIEDEIAKKHGMTHMLERKKDVNGFEVWGDYKKRIEGLVQYFKNCGKLVIVIAHTRDPKTVDDQVITPAGINIPGKGGAYMAAQADLIGFAYRQTVSAGTNFFVTFKGGPLGTWGSRVKELNDKTLQINGANPYKSFKDALSVKTNGTNGSKPSATLKKTTTKKTVKKTGGKK